MIGKGSILTGYRVLTALLEPAAAGLLAPASAKP
jgi:hypothetical protein